MSINYDETFEDDISNRVETFTGGWWVFLMVNVSQKASKTSQIKVGRSPEVVALKSNTNKNRAQNMWTVLLRIGKFDDERSANEFFGCWNKKSRGLFKRVEKGISLVEKYKGRDGRRVVMWITSNTKEKMIAFYDEHRPWFESHRLSDGGDEEGRRRERKRRCDRTETDRYSKKRNETYERHCSCGKRHGENAIT
jgi:hypothetical protein